MSPSALIRLEAELEYGVPVHYNTILITPANTNDVPRVSVARCPSGHVVFVRSDLSTAERTIFSAFDPGDLYAALATEVAFRELGVERIVHCYWYCICRIPDPSEFTDVVVRGDRFVIERDGNVVARAWSAQSGPRVDEVEVETNAAYRRRGYGRQVVAGWAHHVRRQGKIALYSHLVSNEASRALAESLGAWKYAETRELF